MIYGTQMVWLTAKHTFFFILDMTVEQKKMEHTGSREKFSAYISMVWPEEKLMYNFYDEMNSTNTIDHLENLKSYTIKNRLWKKLILIWDNASFHLSKMVMDYINTQKEDDWLNIVYLPKKAHSKSK